MAGDPPWKRLGSGLSFPGNYHGDTVLADKCVLKEVLPGHLSGNEGQIFIIISLKPENVDSFVLHDFF